MLFLAGERDKKKKKDPPGRKLLCSFAGPGSFEETLEPVPHPVWQCTDPLGCATVRLLHGLVHHGSAGLLQHGQPLGTLKRQRLP